MKFSKPLSCNRTTSLKPCKLQKLQKRIREEIFTHRSFKFSRSFPRNLQNTSVPYILKLITHLQLQHSYHSLALLLASLSFPHLTLLAIVSLTYHSSLVIWIPTFLYLNHTPQFSKISVPEKGVSSSVSLEEVL